MGIYTAHIAKPLVEIAPVKKGYYMAAEKLEKLNDCPFCGAHFIEIRYNEERRRYYGYCITCMSKSTECADYDIAVSKWNRRPGTNETGATFHQQPQAEICPQCSIDGTLYNQITPCPACQSNDIKCRGSIMNCENCGATWPTA